MCLYPLDILIVPSQVYTLIRQAANHKSRQQSPISTYYITLASSVGGAMRNQEEDISSSFEKSSGFFHTCLSMWLHVLVVYCFSLLELDQFYCLYIKYGFTFNMWVETLIISGFYGDE